MIPVLLWGGIAVAGFFLSGCSKKEDAEAIEPPPRFEDEITNNITEHPASLIYLNLKLAKVRNREIADQNGNGKVDEDELIATTKDLYQKNPQNPRYREIVGNVFPLAAKYHFQKAMALFKPGQCTPNVNQELKKALEYDPEHLEANLFAGACLEDPSYYRRVLKNNPRDWEAHIALVVLLGKLQRYEEGVQALQDYIRAFPDSDLVKSYNLLGEFQLKQNKSSEAIQAFEKAVSLDPKNAESHKNLGTALWNKGDSKSARKELLEALALDPQLRPEIDNTLSEIKKTLSHKR